MRAAAATAARASLPLARLAPGKAFRCLSARAASIDPALDSEIRHSFSEQGMMATIGASIARLVPGECVLEAPFSSAVSQQHGAFHGGVTASLADSAAGYAAKTLMPAGSDVLATGFSVSLLRPAVGSLLRAKATVLKPGKTLTVSTVEVFAVDDAGKETFIATMQQTSICIARRPFQGEASRA